MVFDRPHPVSVTNSGLLADSIDRVTGGPGRFWPAALARCRAVSEPAARASLGHDLASRWLRAAASAAGQVPRTGMKHPHRAALTGQCSNFINFRHIVFRQRFADRVLREDELIVY